MLGMWDVRDVECSGCVISGIWDVGGVGCSGYGMRDVGRLPGCGILIYKMPDKSYDNIQFINLCDLYIQLILVGWHG